MSYITKSDIEAFLGISLNDNGIATVGPIIEGIEAFVDEETGRTWTHSDDEEIEEIKNGGKYCYFVKAPPIASVVRVIVDGVTLTEGSDFHVFGDHILIPSMAGVGYNNVGITYTTSATEIPADLKHAIVRWVSEIFKSQEAAGKTISKVTLGPMSVEYLTKDGVPAYVDRVIRRYRVITI